MQFKYPPFCTNQVGAWRSLVARLLWEQDAGGSNPPAPTSKFKPLRYTLRKGFFRCWGLIGDSLKNAKQNVMRLPKYRRRLHHNFNAYFQTYRLKLHFLSQYIIAISRLG